MKESVKNFFVKLGIVPKYTEVTLFLMSVAFILIFVTSSQFREEFLSDLGMLPYFIVMFLGIYSSAKHVFTIKKITEKERKSMLFFAIGVNFLAASSSFFYIIGENNKYLLILPLWNFISAVILIILLRFPNIIKEKEMILERQAKIHEVIVGSIAVAIIFLFSQHVFKNYWAITFSLCVSYASTLSEAVNDIFLKKA